MKVCLDKDEGITCSETPSAISELSPCDVNWILNILYLKFPSQPRVSRYLTPPCLILLLL